MKIVLTLSDTGVFWTINDPGRGFKDAPPPPYDLEKYCIMYILLWVLHKFQLDLFRRS